MNQVEFEAYVRKLEADEKQGKAELIEFIRSHDNYGRCLEFVGEYRAALKSVKKLDPKVREMVSGTLELMGGKALHKMTMRDLLFLATWISGPGYLIDQIKAGA
jgi:hypothetical protein